jgi:Fic family protein
MTYIHEQPNWPHFSWNVEILSALVGDIRHRQGRLIGRMESLGLPFREHANLIILTDDVLKTSDIEGEVLDREQVRSSLARRLGLNVAGLIPSERAVEGIVSILLDATHGYALPLTVERLCGWHAALFPTGYSGPNRIKVGTWRDDSTGPMQAISGPLGRERVHFEAPAASRLSGEMERFLYWFEKASDIDPVLKAGVAHLWFVTIHPFEDGNGRIARAIADMALARSELTAERFYSMSSQIRSERVRYYELLEATQRGELDITQWLAWFVGCLGRAFEGAEKTLASVVLKARFWDRLKDKPFNERQLKMINRLLDGFEGNLTSSKWAKLMKCSQDTASRDIEDLLARGILSKSATGGRSTHYVLLGYPNVAV